MSPGCQQPWRLEDEDCLLQLPGSSPADTSDSVSGRRLWTSGPRAAREYLAVVLCAQPVVACRGGPGKRVHTAVWLLWAPLCVLDTRPLSNVSFANIFSQSVACLFIVLTAFFTEQKFLNSDRVQLTPSPACFSFTLCFWCCVRMARHPGHLVFLLWWLPGGARLCLLCLGVWCVRVPSAQGDRPGSRPTFLHVAVPSPQRRLLRLSLPRRAASAP